MIALGGEILSRSLLFEGFISILDNHSQTLMANKLAENIIFFNSLVLQALDLKIMPQACKTILSTKYFPLISRVNGN